MTTETPAFDPVAAVVEQIEARRRAKWEAALAAYRELVTTLAENPNHRPGEKTLKAVADAMEYLDITADELKADVAGLAAWLADSKHFADYDSRFTECAKEAEAAEKEARRLMDEGQAVRANAFQNANPNEMTGAMKKAAHLFAGAEASRAVANLAQGKARSLQESHRAHQQRKGNLFRLFGEYTGPKWRGGVIDTQCGAFGIIETFADGTTRRRA